MRNEEDYSMNELGMDSVMGSKMIITSSKTTS